MKRWMAFALALLCSISLTACGGGETASQTMETTEPIMKQEPSEPAQEPEVLAQQVIYDSDGIKITVMGLEENTMAGTLVRVLVENKTDRNIAFSGDLFVVNGITMPGYLYAEVAAGMKSNDAIELYSDNLEAAGIVELETIRGYDARIVDTDTYDTLTQVPLELQTAYYQGRDFQYDDTGVELYSAEGVTVLAQVFSEEFYGKTAQLLVKNETGKDIILEAQNISVNGYTVDAWLYDTVCADTVRYCQLDLFESSLAENGIDAVETVTFRLNVLDASSFETLSQSEQLTVTVSQ